MCDPDKICRVCLRETKDGLPIFQTKIKNDVPVINFLNQITNLQLIEESKLPKLLCTECLQNISVCFDLVQLCLTSDAALRQFPQSACNNGTELIDSKEECIQIEIEKEDFSDSETIYLDDEKPRRALNKSYILKDRYKCEVCGSTFNNKVKLVKHGKTHNIESPYKCDECLQGFPRKINLVVHMRSHARNEDKKFGCKKCGKQFIYKYLLRQHEYRHSDEKPFPCSECNKGCLTAESLRRHMTIHAKDYTRTKHVCKMCDKEFDYPSNLAEHMKVHTGERPHLCSICGKGFRQTGALHYHQRIHSGYKPFTCEICGGSFWSQALLRVHMRKHTNERPYVCHICGLAFRHSGDLKSHQRRHSGDKPVLCPTCGKGMSSTGQLTIHLRSHTGERPYQCEKCPKAFSTKSMLAKHYRIHTGEKPYVCDICDRAFNQKSTLKTHKKIHDHPPVPAKKRKKSSKEDGSVEKLSSNGVNDEDILAFPAEEQDDSENNRLLLFYKDGTIENIANELAVGNHFLVDRTDPNFDKRLKNPKKDENMTELSSKYVMNNRDILALQAEEQNDGRKNRLLSFYKDGTIDSIANELVTQNQFLRDSTEPTIRKRKKSPKKNENTRESKDVNNKDILALPAKEQDDGRNSRVILFYKDSTIDSIENELVAQDQFLRDSAESTITKRKKTPNKEDNARLSSSNDVNNEYILALSAEKQVDGEDDRLLLYRDSTVNRIENELVAENHLLRDSTELNIEMRKKRQNKNENARESSSDGVNNEDVLALPAKEQDDGENDHLLLFYKDSTIDSIENELVGKNQFLSDSTEPNVRERKNSPKKDENDLEFACDDVNNEYILALPAEKQVDGEDNRLSLYNDSTIDSLENELVAKNQFLSDSSEPNIKKRKSPKKDEYAGDLSSNGVNDVDILTFPAEEQDDSENNGLSLYRDSTFDSIENELAAENQFLRDSTKPNINIVKVFFPTSTQLLDDL